MHYNMQQGCLVLEVLYTIDKKMYIKLRLYTCWKYIIFAHFYGNFLRHISVHLVKAAKALLSQLVIIVYRGLIAA